jgi:hypothetical protein
MTDKTLIERLRRVNPFVNDPITLRRALVNPDGPEAADTLEAQASQIASLTAALEALHGQFDDTGCTCTFPDDNCCAFARTSKALSSTPTDTDKGEG